MTNPVNVSNWDVPEFLESFKPSKLIFLWAGLLRDVRLIVIDLVALFIIILSRVMSWGTMLIILDINTLLPFFTCLLSKFYEEWWMFIKQVRQNICKWGCMGTVPTYNIFLHVLVFLTWKNIILHTLVQAFQNILRQIFKDKENLVYAKVLFNRANNEMKLINFGQ